MAPDGFKYLGIFLTPDPKMFHDCNLVGPLKRLHDDVTHRRLLSLTLPGRAALFKMLALPTFLYALQNCPFPIADTYFNTLEGELRLLLWDGKALPIALQKLTKG